MLSGEDQALLVRGNALLVLDLRLYIVDSIARFHLKGDGFTRQGLDEAAGGKMSVAIRDTALQDRDQVETHICTSIRERCQPAHPNKSIER